MFQYKFLIGLIFFAIISCNANTGSGPAELIIKTDVAWNSEQQRAINDIQSLWEQLSFEGEGEAFVLQLELSELEKGGSNKENIVIVSINNRTLQIESPTPNALIHGIYTWLEHVGLRFYGPGREWTYIPKIVEFSELSWNAKIEPDLRLRYFFSGRGFGQRKFKELEKIKKDWKRWYQRLRLGNPSNIDFGHYGSTFNRKYKQQIKKNPQWRALVDGKRRPWSRRLKLCYTNKQVRQLYVKDALARLKKKQQQGLKPPYYINMEPADGLAYCECDQCRNTSEHLSDSYFELVNAVARALYEKDSRARVISLAYTHHALPPSFPLEKNVYIAVTPDYAVYPASSPHKVMRSWLQKQPKNLFFRGYLGIPQWNHDLPLSKEQQNNYLERVDFIIENDFLGFNYQTSYSYGAVGWLQYVMAHKAWDVSFNGNEARDEFINKMFAGHEKEMQQFYQYLTLTAKSEIYISSARRILKKVASHEAKNSLYEKRLQDLQAYLDFIKLYYDWNKNKNKNNDQSKIALINQIGQMYKTNMVYTFSLYNYKLSQRGKQQSTPLNLTENLPKVDLNQNSTRIKALQATDKNNLLNVPEVKNIEPLFSQWKERGTTQINATSFKGVVEAYLYITDEDNQIKILTNFKSRHRNGRGWMMLKSIDGSYIAENDLKSPNKWNVHLFSVPEPGMYKLFLKLIGSSVKIKLPNIPLAFSKPLESGKSKELNTFYFYVPEGINELFVKFPPKSGKVYFTKPNGDQKSFIIGNGNEMVKVHIDDKGGGVWKIKTRKAGFKLINIPHFVSLSEKAVIK